MRLLTALRKKEIVLQQEDLGWTILTKRRDRLAGWFGSREEAVAELQRMDTPYGRWLWGFRQNKP